MDFYTVLDQAVDLLRQRGRVTYRALKLQFQLDDYQMEALKDGLLYAHPEVAHDTARVVALDWRPRGGPTASRSGRPGAGQRRSRGVGGRGCEVERGV